MARSFNVRSVMPGGAGKCVPQRGGKGGNGGDGFMLAMFLYTGGAGRYFGKISPGDCSHLIG